jgi:hypothetical protein
MARRKLTWTDLQLERLGQVKEVLEELDAYKPLTLRQVYYQLVGKGLIENVRSQYIALSRVLKQARIDGLIPWSDIEDRVRDFHKDYCDDSKEDFISWQQRSLFQGYRRNLMQSQDVYVEVWIEKDALSSIFTRVAKKYGIGVVVCRGFSSVSFLNDFSLRLDRDAEGKTPIMLYFGDFDPSGMEMLESMQITLEDEMGVEGVEFRRVALSKDDISRYNLPHNPDALKKTDTRANKHIQAHGELAVELDALRPDILETKIRLAIESIIDMNLFNQERINQDEDLESIRKLRNKVTSFIDEKVKEMDQDED